MRQLLKFLHTIGAIGFTGSLSCMLAMLLRAPSPDVALPDYVVVRGAMEAIATSIFMPSLAITLVGGLLAMALTDAFHNAGWAWAKLATGSLVFEGGFIRVLGPMQDEAARGRSALAGQIDPATLGRSLGAEKVTLCLFLFIAVANVALGVWRPRFGRTRQSSPGGALSPKAETASGAPGPGSPRPPRRRRQGDRDRDRSGLKS